MSAVLKFEKPAATPARPLTIEAELRTLLRAEAAATRKLASIRAQIGPAKRAYLEKHKCFGMSNEAIMRELGIGVKG